MMTVPQTELRTELTMCSLCLRVLVDSEWIEADRVIRETRSFELDAPPQLHSALCEPCVQSITSRRARALEPIAA